MGLTGDFQNVYLADVLQTLVSKRRTGTLTVRLRAREKRVGVSGEGIRLLTGRTITGFPLGMCLVYRGVISELQLREALARQEKTGERLGASMIALGYCTAEAVEDSTRYQAAEELYELFTWAGATFQFQDGSSEPDRDTPFHEIRFEVSEILEEAERRLEEWFACKERIGNDDEILVRCDPTAPAPNPAEWGRYVATTYWTVDGNRNVAEILRDSHLSLFDTARHLVTLIDNDFIRPCGQLELLKVAQARFKEGDFARAATLLSRAHNAEPARTDILETLAISYESIDAKKKAAGALTALGRLFLQQGLSDRAHAALKKAARYDLRSEEAQVLLTGIHLDRGEHVKAAERSRAAAVLMMEREDYEAALAIIKAPLVRLPEHRGLRTLAANISLKTGRADRALTHLEKVADALEKEGNTRRLGEVYEKMLQIEPDRADLAKKLRSMGEKGEGLPRRKLIRIGAIAGAAVLLLLAYLVLSGDEDDNRFARAERLIAMGKLDKAETIATELKIDGDENAQKLFDQIGRQRTKAARGDEYARLAKELDKRLTTATTAFALGDYAAAFAGCTSLLDHMESPAAETITSRMARDEWRALRSKRVASVKDLLRRYDEAVERATRRAEETLAKKSAADIEDLSEVDKKRLRGQIHELLAETDTNDHLAHVVTVRVLEGRISDVGLPIADSIYAHLGEMEHAHAAVADFHGRIDAEIQKAEILSKYSEVTRRAADLVSRGDILSAREALREFLRVCEVCANQSANPHLRDAIDDLNDDAGYDVDGMVRAELKRLDGM